jgi:PAS domain S-box-containing protein
MRAHLVALAGVGLAVLLRWALDPLLGSSPPLPPVYAAVAIAVWYGGYRPATIAALLGYLASDYLFIEPRGAFGLATGNILGMLLFLLSAGVIIGLGHAMESTQRRMRSAAEAAQEVARQLEHALAAHRRAEAELAGVRDQLAIELADMKRLHELSGRIFGERELVAMLHRVLEVSIELLGADKGNLQLYDERRDALEIVTHLGFDQAFLDAFGTVPAGFSVCGTAAARRERVIVEDAFADPDFVDLAPTFSRHGFVAVQSTPLVGGDGKLVGALTTHFARPHRPSERELRLLDLCALQAERVIERHRADEARREGEERFRLVVEAAPSGLVMIDADGTILLVNSQAEAMFGYGRGELMGRPVEDLVPASLRGEHPRHRARFGAAPRARMMGTGRDLYGLRKDGSEFPVEIGLNPIETPAGMRVLSTIVDITQRKHAEDQLVEHATRLREADRRKDEFLATLSHELRNPLAAISSAAQLLHLEGQKGPQLRWVGEVIDRQVRHLARLVDDLLDVSRVTHGKIELRRERVALADVVEHAVETTRSQVTAQRQHLTVDLGDEPLALDGDPTRLAQVIANLIDNAAKYTPEGGRIRVVGQGEGDEVVLRVRDDGVGIPPENLTGIFDLFAQLDRSLERQAGGLGIGLTLVRRLVELHGGTVEAFSEGPGHGSELVVRLPRPASTAAASEAPRPAFAEPAAGRLVLIAEDNGDAATSLARLLESIGHEVHVVRNGVEAVSAAETLLPDVVLLDLGMPGMNGYDAARQIRARAWGQGMLLVALTGWAHDDDRRRSAAAGFDHHLTKPADLGVLRELLAGPANDAARQARGEPGTSEGEGHLPSSS